MTTYKLFSNCIITRGFSRSTIADLWTQRLFVISNRMAELISNVDNTLVLTSDSQDKIYEFASFLKSNNLAFEIDKDEILLFPPISLEWDDPSIIHNAIFDFDEISNHELMPYINAISDLDNLGCKYLFIRFYKEVQIEVIEIILSTVKQTKYMSVNFLLPYTDAHYNSAKCQIENNRFLSVIFYGCLDPELNQNNLSNKMVFIPAIVKSETACGIINDNYFSTNLDHFTEAQNHNTCLNRKVSIDKYGNIKNCPSMALTYGNIKNVRLNEVIGSTEFQKMWFIQKDQINICKDCEFRYVCSDCRAYLSDPNDLYSKPLKCGYSPYTTEWENWQLNSDNYSSIQYYNL